MADDAAVQRVAQLEDENSKKIDDAQALANRTTPPTVPTQNFKSGIVVSEELLEELMAHQLGLYKREVSGGLQNHELVKTGTKYKGIILSPYGSNPSEYDIFSLRSLIMAIPVEINENRLDATVVWTGMRDNFNNLEYDVSMNFFGIECHKTIMTKRSLRLRNQHDCEGADHCLEDLWFHRKKYAHQALRQAMISEKTPANDPLNTLMAQIDLISYKAKLDKVEVVPVSPYLDISFRLTKFDETHVWVEVTSKITNSIKLKLERLTVIHVTPMDTLTVIAELEFKLEYGRRAIEMALKKYTEDTAVVKRFFDSAPVRLPANLLSDLIRKFGKEKFYTSEANFGVSKLDTTVNILFKEYAFVFSVAKPFKGLYWKAKGTTFKGKWRTWPTTLQILEKVSQLTGKFGIGAPTSKERLLILKANRMAGISNGYHHSQYAKFRDAQSAQSEKDPDEDLLGIALGKVTIRGLAFRHNSKNSLTLIDTPVLKNKDLYDGGDENIVFKLVAVNFDRGSPAYLMNLLSSANTTKPLFLTFNNSQDDNTAGHIRYTIGEKTYPVQSVKVTYIGKKGRVENAPERTFTAKQRNLSELCQWVYNTSQQKKMTARHPNPDTLKQMKHFQFTVRVEKHPFPLIVPNRVKNAQPDKDPPLSTMTEEDFVKTNAQKKNGGESYYFHYADSKNLWDDPPTGANHNPPVVIIPQLNGHYGWYDKTANAWFLFKTVHPKVNTNPASSPDVNNDLLLHLAELLESHYGMFSKRVQRNATYESTLRTLQETTDTDVLKHANDIRETLKREGFHFLKVGRITNRDVDATTAAAATPTVAANNPKWFLRDISFMYPLAMTQEEKDAMFQSQFVARPKSASGTQAIERAKEVFATVPEMIDLIFAIPFGQMDAMQDSDVCDPRMTYKGICKHLKLDLEILMGNFLARRHTHGDVHAWGEYCIELQAVFSVLFYRMHAANREFIKNPGTSSWNSARWSVFVPLSMLYKSLGGKAIKSRKSDLFEAREFVKQVLKVNFTTLLSKSTVEIASFITATAGESDSVQTEALTQTRDENAGKWYMTFTEFNSTLKTNLVNFFASADHALELCGLMLARRSPLIKGMSPISQSVVDVAIGTLELTMLCYATCCKISLLHLGMPANHKAGPLGYAHPGLWETAISGRDIQLPLEEMDAAIESIMRCKTIAYDYQKGEIEIKPSKIEGSKFDLVKGRAWFRDRRTKVVADCQADVETAMRELNNILAIESNYNLMVPDYGDGQNSFIQFDRTGRYNEITHQLNDITAGPHKIASCNARAVSPTNNTNQKTLFQSILAIDDKVNKVEKTNEGIAKSVNQIKAVSEKNKDVAKSVEQIKAVSEKNQDVAKSVEQIKAVSEKNKDVAENVEQIKAVSEKNKNVAVSINKRLGNKILILKTPSSRVAAPRTSSKISTRSRKT